jgi:hypothetical protein
MKFFKWQIETKIKRLDANDRIVYLANQLLQEVENAGVSPRTITSPETYLNLEINVHRYDTDQNELTVRSAQQGCLGGFKGKCTANIKPIRGINQ